MLKRHNAGDEIALCHLDRNDEDNISSSWWKWQLRRTLHTLAVTTLWQRGLQVMLELQTQQESCNSLSWENSNHLRLPRGWRTLRVPEDPVSLPEMRHSGAASICPAVPEHSRALRRNKTYPQFPGNNKTNNNNPNDERSYHTALTTYQALF